METGHLWGVAAVPLLIGLRLPVWAKDTGYLFVSSEKDNAVRVLDGETHQIVKQIGTAARPRHLQFSPDRSLIYVAAGDGDAIDVIDVQKLELVDRIEGVDDPELFDLSADGRTMYISLEDDAKLGILDLETYFAEREETPELTVAAPIEGELADEDDEEEEEDEDEEGEAEDDDDGLPAMTTIDVGEEPEGILASADGRTVYVTSEVADIVHVVDVDAGEITANVVVGNRPRRFAMTPDRREFWVSNELSGSVTILDVATNQILETIEFLPTGFRPEQVTPVGITMTDDGKTAIVALGRANHVAFVDIANREIEDYVLVGERAWNTTLHRDNALLYVVNGLSDDVSIIDVADRAVLTSIPVGRVPHTVLIDD
jgi:YVTN family beta-propeller protein